jgi:hypothetical protein
VKPENRLEQVVKFWPFFRYAEDGRGLVHFYFPDLMPVDWEGLERHYGMLFRIFEYYNDGQGKEVTKLLWGLYHHQRQKDLERIELGFLFTYLKEKDLLEISFLKGLLGYRRKGLQRRMQILYLPISWREPEVPGPPPGFPAGG